MNGPNKRLPLEKRVAGIGPGKIIRLYHPNLEVAGWTLWFDRNKIRLSYENPLSKKTIRWYFRSNTGAGDRIYDVSKFKDFEVLTPDSQDSQNTEGKIERADIGDIVLLKLQKRVNAAVGPQGGMREVDAEIDIAGYIVTFDADSVTLSHENPFSQYTGLSAGSLAGLSLALEGAFRRSLTRGNRVYVLNGLQNCVILKKHKPEEINEKA